MPFVDDMISQATGSPQQGTDVKQGDELTPKLVATSPALSSSHLALKSSSLPTSLSRLPADVPQYQPQTDSESEIAYKRGMSLTSQGSLDTLTMQPELSPKQDSELPKDELALVGSRESIKTRPEKVPSRPEGLSDPSIKSLGNLRSSEEPHASPLDALLSPTTTPLPQTESFARDSVAGSEFGEVRLDDDERFSTVSLDAAAAAARDSTVAIKSPVDEEGSKPWAGEEPEPSPSEIASASVRTSFLLQRLGNDGAPASRRSLDGQHKLQEVFERAQRDSKELEGDIANVDWGKCSPVLFVQTALTHV